MTDMMAAVLQLLQQDCTHSHTYTHERHIDKETHTHTQRERETKMCRCVDKLGMKTLHCVQLTLSKTKTSTVRRRCANEQTTPLE